MGPRRKSHKIALFLIASAALLLLGIGGITNRWGADTYILLVKDSTLTWRLDTLHMKPWIASIADSVGSGTGQSVYVVDREHGSAPAWIIDSSADASNKQYTLGYSWYNHSWLTGGYVVYANGTQDSGLVQWPNGYAIVLGSSATPDRLAYKSSINGGAYSPSSITAPPIGDDSCMISARIVGNSTAGTRTFVLLKHNLATSAITPGITSGTEVFRQQLSGNAFGSFGTGTVYVRVSLRFARFR